MDLKDFTINGRIEIIEDNITYTSIIQDKDRDSITINIPYSGNKYYPLHPEMGISFILINKSYILKYSGIVSEAVNEGTVRLFKIINIRFIEKIQRRSYYRHSITLPIKYCVIPKQLYSFSMSQLIDALKANMASSVTRDISGGGMCIALKKTCDLNDRLLISLTIKNEPINIICSAVRLWNDKESAIFVAGLRYIDIDENTRDKIIKFIFEKLIATKKLFS